MKTNDPQITVMAKLKEGAQGELLCFSFRLGFFELAVIANIPADGETEAPAYIKFKINSRPQHTEHTTQETT
jgi:hypothetical protein